jgi:hypothetical protein
MGNGVQIISKLKLAEKHNSSQKENGRFRIVYNPYLHFGKNK